MGSCEDDAGSNKESGPHPWHFIDLPSQQSYAVEWILQAAIGLFATVVQSDDLLVPKLL